MTARKTKYEYAAIVEDVACHCCGTARATEFCAVCGQNSKDYRASFLGLLASFISETFELDGRMFRTLGALFTQPGFLAQEFSKNRRATYMSPARLYFFTSVLFFFMLSVFGSSDEDESSERSETVQVQIDTAIEERETRKSRDDESLVDPETLKPLLNESQLQSLERILASPDNMEKKLAIEGLAKSVEKIRQEFPGESPWWLTTFAGKTVAAVDDPQELRRTFIDNVPLSMFVLLPAYALLLKLLFYRRRPPIYYAEHFVFALYLHVLAFLIFSINLLVPEGTWYEVPLFIITILSLGYYSYRAMRVYYERRRWQTLWRFGVLGLGYLLLFIPAFAAVMVYSFISF